MRFRGWEAARDAPVVEIQEIIGGVTFAELKAPRLKAALVIDTHHLRILRRLGFVNRRSGLKQAYDRMMPLLPSDWPAADLDHHHWLMKALGQTICRHSAPICHHCPLNGFCPTAADNPADHDRFAQQLSAFT